MEVIFATLFVQVAIPHFKLFYHHLVHLVSSRSFLLWWRDDNNWRASRRQERRSAAWVISSTVLYFLCIPTSSAESAHYNWRKQSPHNLTRLQRDEKLVNCNGLQDSIFWRWVSHWLNKIYYNLCSNYDSSFKLTTRLNRPYTALILWLSPEMERSQLLGTQIQYIPKADVGGCFTMIMAMTLESR